MKILRTNQGAADKISYTVADLEKVAENYPENWKWFEVGAVRAFIDRLKDTKRVEEILK